MTTEQTIQDVAMIARNGIDRVIELERENKRLAEALYPKINRFGKAGKELRRRYFNTDPHDRKR